MRVFLVIVFMAWFFCSNAQLPLDSVPVNFVTSQVRKGNRDFINLKNIAPVNQPPNSSMSSVNVGRISLKPKSTGQLLHNRTSASNQSMSVADEYICYDTSFTKLIGLENQWVYVHSGLHTSDDGVLVSGEMLDSTAQHPGWHIDGFLMKTDNQGNVSWIKQIADAEPHEFYGIYVFQMLELSNKDIIALASIDTTSSHNNEKTIVLRLNAKGDILWTKTLKSALVQSTIGASIDIKTVAEGPGGDLIFGGTTINNNIGNGYETVIRMTASGDVVWDANYGNVGDYRGGTDGIAAYIINGNIVLCGISYGSYYTSVPIAINFLTLDYTTGNLLDKVFTVPDYTDAKTQNAKSILPYTGKCLRLNNGHYIVYGETYARYFNLPDTLDQFASTEFDENFNVINAHTIRTPPGIAVNGDFMRQYPDGKTDYIYSRYLFDSTFDIFLVTEKNNQLLKSRKMHYDKIGNAGSISTVPLNDGSYIYLQSHFDLHDPDSVISYAEFKKLHNSDTASDCLGTDSVFTTSLPFKTKQDAGYYALDDNLPNQISDAGFKIAVSDTLTHHTENGCVQKNYCDTVSIHGNNTICGSDDAILFTVYKNSACGAFAQWDIDTSVINSLQQLNDTTVSVHFKNINWTGNIYAMLPASKCFTATPTDSLLIHLTRTDIQLSLGADTMLCGSDASLLLHAGAGFKTYKWQDGSTDSVFLATTAGKYYVTVTDYCGSLHSDTIKVSKANDIFSIGNDTTKCNSDSVIVKATPGFTNYKWQPNYNMINVSANAVQVYPAVDTAYTVSAQKGGCTFFDTIHISVLHSPAIFLGNDTAICKDTKLQLHAGNGFVKYLWNTGEQTASIYAAAAGSYSVKATAANNCISADTLLVTAIKPLPVFSLGNDTGLCKNQSLSYNFNLPGATYLWSDGSMANQKNITEAGDYWLKVTQDLCSATDSITVVQKTSPMVALGNDTTLCEGTTKLLDATYAGADYTWQDGSTNAQYMVSQPGLYSVMLTLEGCTAGDSIDIGYMPAPLFTLGKDTAICNGSEIILQPGMNTSVNYYWQNGSTLPYYTVTQPGNYFLTASNKCGSYTDSILVKEAICNIILPSAFTPNHDGLNDVFRIKYPPLVKSYNMVIYNRWGEQVFTSKDISKGWNGTYKGYPVSQDTFVWIISVIDINGAKTSLHGTVTVIR
ncbi:MAG TPA: gliding motility-associated C-terminal domain-containing protein [Parafilimonas sp.]|nr:gliding motility-associated C-terminal domain-containing protein [Parafilimonas sp.]